jgi:hypothetical protein
MAFGYRMLVVSFASLAVACLSSCGGGGGSAAVPSAVTAGGAAGTGSAGGSQSASATSAAQIVQAARTHVNSSSSITIALSSPPNAGDVLVAQFSYDALTHFANTPVGWHWIGKIEGTAEVGEAAYWHAVAAGESGSYTFSVYNSGTTDIALTVEEISGANASNPVANFTSSTAPTGYSITTPSLSGTNVLPLGLFTQFDNGQEPSGFGGTWPGAYPITFAGAYMVSQEFQVGPVSTGNITDTEQWSGGDNSQQVSLLLLLALGPNAPATGASHVHQELNYGGSSMNLGIPASWLTQHADFALSAWGVQATAFMSAGGKYAILYTDPNLIPYCSTTAPFANCAGPMGNVVESGFLHDSNGVRLHVSGTGQDRTNPASSAMQAAFQSYTSSQVSGSTANTIMMDDATTSYTASYFDYKFGATAEEIDSQPNPAAYWVSGMEALAQASVKPIIYNGGFNDSSDQTFLQSANILGKMVEGCFVNAAWRNNDTQGNPQTNWPANADNVLFATSVGKYAVCLNYDTSPTSDPLGDRIYALSSWWLTYDPNYSVAMPEFNAPDSAGGYGSQNFAEYDIVPTQPLSTASGDNINTLQSSGGAYVREFAACYQAGKLIGGCAAVVNPHYGKTVSMPTLQQSYSNSLVLTNASEYNGGTATFTGPIPTSLGQMTGVILH